MVYVGGEPGETEIPTVGLCPTSTLATGLTKLCDCLFQHNGDLE